MDKVLNPNQRRKKQLKYLLVTALGIAVVIWSLSRIGLAPAVDSADLQIDTVTRGPIQAELNANGTVLPSRTHWITSPVASRLLEVLVQPGEQVSAGTELLRLDTNSLQLDMQSLNDRIALASNEMHALKLELAEKRQALVSRQALADVDLEAQRTRSKKYHELYQTHTVSELDWQGEEIKLRKATIQRQQLDRELISLTQAMQAKIDNKVLERKILEQEKAQLTYRLNQAAVRAPVDGVVLQILDQPGKSIAIGDQLARVADLTHYKIEAGIAEFFATQIVVGNRADMKLGDTVLGGAVSKILPDITAGTVKLEIQLDQPSHTELKPNRRVDVRLIIGHKADTLTVQNRGFASAAIEQDAFVVNAQGEAHKRRIRIGLSNRDKVELLSGVQAGERIIISDISDYTEFNEFRIKP